MQQSGTTIKLNKNLLIGAAFFTLLIVMLIFPQTVLQGASNGLLLWFNTLLPVLLPFIIITSILIRLDVISVLSSFIYPICKPFFPISRNGAYPVFIGFLCGLPIGAKISADLTRHHDITKEEGTYIACMCNNTSPAFLLNYVAATHLLDISLGLPLCIIVCVSSMIASRIVYSFYINKKRKPEIRFSKIHAAESPQNSSVLNSIDLSIMNGFETVTRLGGYIILFSILAELLSLLRLPAVIVALLSGFLEITTGVKKLGMLNISTNLKFVIASGFAGFGGMSALAQTQSVTSSSGISIKSYFMSKSLQSLIAIALSFLYVNLF